MNKKRITLTKLALLLVIGLVEPVWHYVHPAGHQDELHEEPLLTLNNKKQTITTL